MLRFACHDTCTHLMQCFDSGAESLLCASKCIIKSGTMPTPSPVLCSTHFYHTSDLCLLQPTQQAMGQQQSFNGYNSLQEGNGPQQGYASGPPRQSSQTIQAPPRWDPSQDYRQQTGPSREYGEQSEPSRDYRQPSNAAQYAAQPDRQRSGTNSQQDMPGRPLYAQQSSALQGASSMQGTISLHGDFCTSQPVMLQAVLLSCPCFTAVP